LKITDIDFAPLALEIRGTGASVEPLESAEVALRLASESAETMAARRYAPPEAVLVRIRTDAGVEGLGEGATLPHYLGHGTGSLIDWLTRFRRALVGCDPLNIAGLHQRMETVAGIGVPGCRPAQAAVDMAAHDLAGKVLDCPVYELLGGARRTEFDLQTQMHGHTPEQLLDVCHHYMDQGFRALKLKIGGRIRREGYAAHLLDEEFAKIAKVTGTLPGHIQLDVDANQALSNAKTAIAFFEGVRRVAFHPNMAIEQPLHHLDLAGHAFIRRVLPFPVVLDEAITSPAAMIQVVRMEAADRIVLKPNRVGGLWPARKIASICEANGIGISLDTMPFTRLGDTMLCHLAATLKQPYAIDAEGHTYFASTPFTGGVELEGGRARIGRAPGFGVLLAECLPVAVAS
jgi:L-alanine-DL-glutamate epimerase-like enolase superfamily enzyme